MVNKTKKPNKMQKLKQANEALEQELAKRKISEISKKIFWAEQKEVAIGIGSWFGIPAVCTIMGAVFNIWILFVVAGLWFIAFFFGAIVEEGLNICAQEQESLKKQKEELEKKLPVGVYYE